LTKVAPARTSTQCAAGTLSVSRSTAFEPTSQGLARLKQGVAFYHQGQRVGGAQVAVADYCPHWWPATTRLLIRRVRLDLELGQVSADPRARRRRTLPCGHAAVNRAWTLLLVSRSFQVVPPLV
jgi:hypothetical protein